MGDSPFSENLNLLPPLEAVKLIEGPILRAFWKRQGLVGSAS